MENKNMIHFIMTCYLKNQWRIYATPIRHIQNLRTILRNPQKMRNGVNTPPPYAIC